MIGVAGHRAVRAEGEHHMRTEPANVERQVADYPVKILAVELVVGIVQHDSLGDFQDFTGGGKLLPPHSGQFLVAGGATAMARRLPRSKADHASLGTTIVTEAPRTAKAAGLVVRMGGDAHQAKHGFHCNLSVASQRLASELQDFALSHLIAAQRSVSIRGHSEIE